MAISGLVTSTMAVLALALLVKGQYQLTESFQACTSANAQAVPLMPHHNYCELFVQCDGALNRLNMKCGQNLLYDNSTGTCTWPYQAVCPQWQCIDNAQTPRKFPGLCCETYYECANPGYVQKICPNGQSFNTASGNCEQRACTDNPLCSRPATNPPTVPVLPVANCTHEAVPGNPCAFRTRTNDTLSIVRPCAEGTSYNSTYCTCVATEAPLCYRNNNNNINKIADPLCRASMKVNFLNIKPSGTPQLNSDKGGIQTDIPDELKVNGVVQMAGGQATFTPSTQNNNVPYFYWYAASNNQMGMNWAASFTFRALSPGAFVLLSNSYEGACSSNLEWTCNYNGNSAYQCSFVITGFVPNNRNGWASSSVTLNANINVGPLDFIRVVVTYSGRATVQINNLGQSGQQNQGQPVTVASTDYLGSILGFTKCGYQLFRNFPGIVRDIRFYESCTDLTIPTRT